MCSGTGRSAVDSIAMLLALPPMMTLLLLPLLCPAPTTITDDAEDGGDRDGVRPALLR